MTVVYLGLGTNLGDRERMLEKALELLGREMEICEVSSVYETEPVGYTEQPWFLNAVCRAESDLSPRALLETVKRIEKEVGREATFRWGPRIVDVDILLYDEECLREEDLEIPHPRLRERGFVLTPLREIAPHLIHPATKERIADLEENVGRTSQVRLWERRTQCTK